MNELMTSRQQQEQQQHGSNQFGAVASNWYHFADVTGDDDDDASVLLITFKLIFSNGPLTHYNFFFWGNEQSTASFSVILGIFKAIIKKLQQINLKNYPSCTRCPDSNTQLLPHEVPRVTTRPGRLSSFPSSSHCTDKYYCHRNCFGFERFWKQLSAHCARANVLYMFLSTLIIEGIQWLCWLNIQGMTSRNYSYNKSKIEERQTDRLNIIYKCQFYCLGSTGIDCLVVAGQKKFKLPSKKP